MLIRGLLPVPLQQLFPSGGLFDLHTLWAAVFVALFFVQIVDWYDWSRVVNDGSADAFAALGSLLLEQRGVPYAHLFELDVASHPFIQQCYDFRARVDRHTACACVVDNSLGDCLARVLIRGHFISTASTTEGDHYQPSVFNAK